ncbi:MAG: MFS transporter [Pseudomonadota bacterium]|nr:MFS transporter [Pseudomonadota bacterium]
MTEPESPRQAPTGLYPWLVVVMLMIAYALSFVDRQILSLLVEPIKADLAISDSQVGLLQGLAFALFYTLAGLPIGRLADYSHRRNIIAIGIAFWSVMTFLCALPKTFFGFFLARMGVGVGEAALSPSAYSMMSDYFPRERIGTAVGIYNVGIYVGAGLALVIGGVLIEAVPLIRDQLPAAVMDFADWRIVFMVVGLPGVLLALAFLLLVREPARRYGAEVAGAARLSIADSLAFVTRRWRRFFGFFVGMTLQSIIFYALLSWVPTHFIREFAWSQGRIGLALGIVMVIFGSIGVIAGGLLCDRFWKRGVADAPILVSFLSLIGVAVAVVLAVAGHQLPTVQLLAVGIALFSCSLMMTAGPAGLQNLLPNQLRAQVSATYLFVLNLVSLTLGPLLPALISDHLFRDEGMIGLAVVIVVAGLCLILVPVYYLGRRLFAEDMRREAREVVA